MRKSVLAALFSSTSLFLFSQDKYQYSADLKNIVDDKIAIELLTPTIKEQEIIFSFPRVIPGSYSEKNYGKFVEDFMVFDKDGKKLKTKKINKNQFEIKDATKIAKISYKMNDTWDTPDKDFIFQPGGSNIESGSNVVLNNHAFFGYFEGYRNLPFEVKVVKPATMYASTHLEVNRKSAEEDLLTAKNYFTLADNPVFYCKPDTTSFKIGNTNINVSVFSATGKVKSGQIAGYLKPMALALQKFFDGLPVDSYQFLYYFEDPEKALTEKGKGGGYGALEHHYSSLYFLPEMSLETRLQSMVNEVSSHEFLHILTPLNLHSEHIENFDFVKPTMSRHLWLYEGVTEYFANLVQAQHGLITEKQFFENMRDKINQAEEYGDFSMTEMSQKVLEDGFQKKYSSVYNRGALLGLVLDILIREKTNHTKDLKSVVQSLAKKYGPGKPFNDENFLKEFVDASHPDVQGFIDSYITGGLSLPLSEYFAKAGYEYAITKKMDVYFVGRMGLKFDEPSASFQFTNVEKNAFDLQNGDAFIAMDDKKVTETNLDGLWEEYFMKNTTHPEASITIKRNGETKTLKGPLLRGYVEMKNYVGPNTTLTADQKTMLSKLMKGD